MDFKEYLWAMGEGRLAEGLSSLDSNKINTFRDRYIEFLRQYYVVGGMPEVDYLYQKGGNVIPLEVKAETYLRARSLHYYYEKYSPVYAVRVSMAGLEKQDWLVNLPLWAVRLLPEIEFLKERRNME